MLKKFWWLLPLLLLLAVAGFVAWSSDASQPMPEALAALQPNEDVAITQSPWLTFSPARQQPEVGFIFYPGGKVDFRAYAPAARAIANQGYFVVIPAMPLNLAVFAPNKAKEIIQAFPQVKTWVIGGHSLGGSMACAFAFSNPGSVKGVVLWASYPAESNSLADKDLAVISISGSEDGLSTPAKIEASRPFLPAGTQFVAIQGGNHAQFGWYGPQAGDNLANISRPEQQKQVVQETVNFLAQFR